jgi:outer membrane protein assembly factor BamD (BamD/ComL family)
MRGLGGTFTIIIICFLGFVGFVIYYIFKQLQFILQAMNLYKDMVIRQDVMIKLLSDICSGKKESEKLTENYIGIKKTNNAINEEISRQNLKQDPHAYSQLSEEKLVDLLDSKYKDRDFTSCVHYLKRLTTEYPDSDYVQFAKQRFTEIIDSQFKL